MALLDAYGRPVRTQALTREHAAPQLTGIRTIWTETVAGGLTPQSLASILRSAADNDHGAYLTLAEEMEERDLHYACELSKRKLAVSRLPVTVESYSDDQKDVDLADAVRGLVRKPGFRGLIKDLLDGLGKGFSVCEIRWDRSGAQWKPREYTWRDPHFFTFDQVSRTEIRLRDDADLMNGIQLEPFCFIRHVPKIKSGIPIRGGIARIAAWAWMCKGYTIKDWLAFAEVFGMPFRIGRYDPGAGEEDKAVLRMAVANLGTDAAAIFPKSMDVEFKEAQKAGSTDFFQRLADYLDAQVSRGILGQTATTQGTPGKLGNEEAQKEVREDIRDDDAEQIEETINRDLIKAYIDLNFGPQENYPTVHLRASKPENITALSESLAKLVPLGLRVEQSVIRDKLGLPDPDKRAKPEDLLRPAAAIPDLSSAQNRETIARNAQAADDGDAGDAIDALTDEELSDWEPVMTSLIDPVERLIDDVIARGGTLSDLLERLPELFEKQDPAALTDTLATAMMKARGMGDATDEV
jgi:phage gp29-like protein